MVLAIRSRVCANHASPKPSQNCHSLCFFWIGGVGVLALKVYRRRGGNLLQKNFFFSLIFYAVFC